MAPKNRGSLLLGLLCFASLTQLLQLFSSELVRPKAVQLDFETPQDEDTAMYGEDSKKHIKAKKHKNLHLHKKKHLDKHVEKLHMKLDGRHKVAGLSCEKYGGPSDEIAAEMVYWRDIPSDAFFVSPFKNVGPKTKYLTFEPDEGGWNNIRMAMETAVTMAVTMGRILVMPPEHKMYLLWKQEEGQKHHFSYKDFFHFDSVEDEHPGLHIISFEDFLRREAMEGKMRDRTTGQVSFPPDNRTNWDGFQNWEAGKKGVFPWIRTVSKRLDWNWGQCMAGFPAEPGHEGVGRLRSAFKGTFDDVPQNRRIESYVGNPTPVDASPKDRMRELRASRQDICVYDESMQEEKFIHMMGDNASKARMLVHFYIFLFFENWKQDLWTKRFVRDHLRYVDEIQCAAARVVAKVREKARQNGNAQGEFHTMHIRRGDFQYKNTRIEASQIYANTRDLLPPNSTLYIASDEQDKTFFKIFQDHYHVYFLDDFKDVLNVNTNYYGMLDQRIASRGKVFIGTYFSTFTGYINRIRGYHAQKDELPGHERGEIESYYYVPPWTKGIMKTYSSPQEPFWGREFPVGWTDIDKDVEDSIYG